MKTVFVISTMIIGRKNFVAARVKNLDDKKLVEYTINVNAAKHFNSESEAASFREKISNPHSREFVIEPTEVDPEKVQRTREFMDELR
jgi:hypothetical protein